MESRRIAVARAVTTMRERLHEPLTLDDLAHEAFLSPYHFNRVFRSITGVPPGRFLAAVRMQAAKTLLLTSPLRVSDICLEVGYLSLGTFTTHFRQHVGISPSRMRRLAEIHGDSSVAALAVERDVADERALTLRVAADDDFEGTGFIGIFTTPLPQAYPLDCAVVRVPTTTRLHGDVDNGGWVLACAFARSLTIREALLASDEVTRVAVAWLPAASRAQGRSVALELRSPGAFDPPVLLALPLVLADSVPLAASA
jgi:AraC family transcriptional regulator